MTSGSIDKYPTNLEGITIENKEDIQEEIKGTEEEETQRNKKLKVKLRYTGARPRGSKWVSDIKLPKNKSLWLGTFEEEEQAARAYDAALICLKGFQAIPKLNFPPDLALDRSSNDGLDTGKITQDHIQKIARLAAHSGTFPSSSATNDPAISSCLPPSPSMAHSVEQIDTLATHSGTPSLPSSSNNPTTTLSSCMSPFHSPSPSLENLVEQESANEVWDDQDFGEDGDIKLWSSP